MAGTVECTHPDIKVTQTGRFRFLNCTCGFHETWESLPTPQPWDVSFVPSETLDRYVRVEMKVLMNPLVVEALLTLGLNDPAKTATLAAVMLEEATRARVLAKFEKEDGDG